MKCILLSVSFVKGIAALHTELRRFCGILGFPAALIALILLFCCRLRIAAFGAEFALVYCSAGAGPAVVGGLCFAAFGTKLAGSGCAAGAGPRVS